MLIHPSFRAFVLRVLKKRLFLLSAAWLLWDPGTASAQVTRKGLDGLEEKPLSALTGAPLNGLGDVGKAALALDPSRWKHAETDHFIYHFFNSYVATPVSVEAEFYHRVILDDLEAGSRRNEAKIQVYLFEEPALWQSFQSKAQLDPWTGGIHAGGSLFLLRDRSMKFKGNTLGHEIVHAVLAQRLGPIPLWLNEGYAEYASNLAYASFLRARGYAAKPRVQAVAEADYIPLRSLVTATVYPVGDATVSAFYTESERLVRLLRGTSKEQFTAFLSASSKGMNFESALSTSFGKVFSSTDDLERVFRASALSDE